MCASTWARSSRKQKQRKGEKSMINKNYLICTTWVCPLFSSLFPLLSPLLLSLSPPFPFYARFSCFPLFYFCSSLLKFLEMWHGLSIKPLLYLCSFSRFLFAFQVLIFYLFRLFGAHLHNRRVLRRKCGAVHQSQLRPQFDKYAVLDQPP